MKQRKIVLKKKDFEEGNIINPISNQRSNYASSSVDNKSQNNNLNQKFIQMNREFSSTHLENKRKQQKNKLGTIPFFNQNLLSTR
jgi:hypothetical protein